MKPGTPSAFGLANFTAFTQASGGAIGENRSVEQTLTPEAQTMSDSTKVNADQIVRAVREKVAEGQSSADEARLRAIAADAVKGR